MWRVLLRALQIGSALCLCFAAIVIQLPAGAQLELPSPTTLVATTLPTVSLTTTSLTETTLSSLATLTTEATSNVISTVDDTTGTTLALIDDSIEEAITEEPSVSGAVSPLLEGTCTEGSSLMESGLLDCESQMSTSTWEPASSTVMPFRSAGPEADEEEIPDTATEEKENQEEKNPPSSEPATDPEEEAMPNLIDRLIAWIDQLFEGFDVEVAGIQLLSATGVAVMLIAAVAIGLLLTGLGVVKLPDWFPGSTTDSK